MPLADLAPYDGAHIDRPDALQREQFTISELTAEFGVTARALRFYEEEGMIAPQRQGLSRIYSKRDRARLAWIVRAKNVGFSLTEIKELIDLYDLGDGRVTQKQRTIERCREQVGKLTRQRDDIDSAIAELTGFIAQLEALADGCLLVTTAASGPYPAYEIAQRLDPRLVGEDLAGAIRTGLDDPPSDYATRAAGELAPHRREAVQRVVSGELLARLAGVDIT